MQSYACQLGKQKFVLDRELKSSLSNDPLQSQYQQQQ